MTTQVIPSIAIQEVYSGGQFTGVASDGTPTEETLFRGREQKWIGGTVGGEFSAPALVGMRVEKVFWSLDCAVDPDITIHFVDDDGVEYLVHSVLATPSGIYAHRDDGFLVPPGFKVRFRANQVIDALVAIAGEPGPVGDGSSVEYLFSAVNGRIEPGSVSLVAGAVTFTDPGKDGVLVGVGGSGGSGTVDYLTGTFYIVFPDPSDFPGPGGVVVGYDYNVVGRVGLVINQGWGQPTPSQTGMIGRENIPPTMQRS